MTRGYDNWERLVAATLDREKLRELARSPSMESASFNSSMADDLDFPENFSFDSAPDDNRTNPKKNKNKDSRFGILAFEAAEVMSRLVSLYKSLSEMSTLKNDVLTSKGGDFLYPGTEAFLLDAAWAERLEDLRSVADFVARIGKKCNHVDLRNFDLARIGRVVLGKQALRGADKEVRKMEKLVSTTRNLRYSAAEALTEMGGIHERNLKQMETQKVILFKNLKIQRHQVRHFLDISLWSKKLNKIIEMMARIVCVVYIRISGSNADRDSVPTVRPGTVFHSAPGNMVGGSGLAVRYANVILLAEKYLNSTTKISPDDRELLYEMLPVNMKALVEVKLRGKDSGIDASLAEEWREAVEDMMKWLAPVAQDTITWQMQRNPEKMKWNQEQEEKPPVLLAQTLHFADKEKTEAAITKVLVGLNCIFRFENQI